MVDRYTKSVLTVIAAALVLLAIQGADGQPRAQFNRFNEVLKVQICAPTATLSDSTQCASVLPTSGTSGGWALAVSSK
jgi:hypothetical protein